MPRPEKVQAVADIKERIENAKAVFLAEYAGLSVAQQQTLRRELKANGAEFKVVKMTLARLAASELDIDTLDEHLLGPTGLAIADGDAVAAAKVLKDFAGANDVFKVKGGLLGLDYLSPERISELADIEPRDVLLAKMAGLFAAPMSNTAGLVAALQRDLVGLVQALVGKREEDGEVAAPVAEAEAPDAADEADAADAAPAEDAPAEEASADEAAEDAPAAEAADDSEPEAAAEEVAAEADSADADGDAEPEAAADEAAPEATADEGETEEQPAEADEADAADDADDDGAPSDEGDAEEAEEE